MNLLFNKRVKAILDKGSLLVSYVCLGICILLIACNIAFFIFFSEKLLSAGIVISNVLTILFTFIAFRPTSKIIQKLLVQKQEELKSQDNLLKKIGDLEAANNDLAAKLDIKNQAESLPSNIDFTFKLEKAEYTKIGYFVKEDSFEELSKNESIKETIPSRNIFISALKAMHAYNGPDPRKILHIHREYYKASIGIDFDNIRFAVHKDKIYFYGVEFSKIHDITSELKKSKNDVELCLVYKESDGKLTLCDGDKYRDICESYSKLQQEIAHNSLEEEVAIVCKEYTTIFRECILERFPCICFTDAIDYFNEQLEWQSLTKCSMTRQVAEIASNMLLLATAINKTQSIEAIA